MMVRKHLIIVFFLVWGSQACNFVVGDFNADAMDDTTTSSDTSTNTDAGTNIDTGATSDTGTNSDTGTTSDADTTISTDTTIYADTSTNVDTSTTIDTDTSTDTATNMDTSTTVGTSTDSNTDTHTATDTDAETESGTDTGTNMDTSILADTGTDSDTSVDSSNDLDTDTNTEPEVLVCGDKRCDLPPENMCSNDFDLRVYEPFGWCENDTCFYHNQLTRCAVGDCFSGMCQSSQCQGFFCNDLPEPKCKDEDVLLVYNTYGRCFVQDGLPACNYEPTEIPCAAGCNDGRCQEDSCAGIHCVNPPARFCDGLSVVRASNGSYCDQGQCYYKEDISFCSASCDLGHCNDEDICANIDCRVPPAPYCIDDSVIATFSKEGICKMGKCVYEQQNTNCPGGCKNGKCSGDPCAGVVCTDPPASYCDGDKLVHWNGGPAKCVDGVCSYNTAAQICSTGCESGQCKNSPCEGVLCIVPPANFCSQEGYLVEYPIPGSCGEGGLCKYLPSTSVCPGVCQDGVCVD